MSKVIAVNSGSSSLKFQLFQMPEEKVLTSGQAERIGLEMGIFTINVNGEKVRLLSCNTGSTDTGFAQQLANALGVEVEAPSNILIVYPNGKYKIGYDGKGKMITFKPQKRK